MLLKALRTLLLLSFLAAQICAGSALAAGTTPLALVPQLDSHGNVAAGCQLYFFQAGTTSTLQNAFSDFGLTQALPNPLSCDQGGRVPMHWLADGLIHIRLTDSSGIDIVDTTMQTLGPSSGGGGGGSTVDPTAIASTGDEKVRYDTAVISGWVRENGLTIGNATSGATERANADTQNLFIYLYGKDATLVVSGGRTGNALNDYNASKTIALPDMRGMANAGLADMGNTPTSALTTTYAGCASVTTLGEGCGSQNQNIGQTNFPNISLPLTGSSGTVNVTSTVGGIIQNATIVGGITAGTGSEDAFAPGASAGTVSSQGSFTPSGTTSLGGSGTPLATVQPIRLKTFYIKL